MLFPGDELAFDVIPSFFALVGGYAIAFRIAGCERCDNLELVNDLEGDGVEVREGHVDDVVLHRVEHRRDAHLRRERERAGRSSCLSFGSLRSA